MRGIVAWLMGRLPPDWYVGPPELETDSDEVFVIGELTEPSLAETASDEDRETARRSRIEGFRETTRERRVKIAQEAEREFGRKVSWGARCGSVEVLFSHVTAPTMTHLGMRERRVLDTVVDAGLAGSRSDALIWCVRMVGEHEFDWPLRPQHVDTFPSDRPGPGLTGALSLRELRSALTRVKDLRD